MRTEGLAATRRDTLGAGPAPGQQRAGFGRALRSELTKIRTVRSTYWTLIAMTVSTVIIGVFSCALTGPGAAGPGYDPTYLSLEGCIFGQLIIAVLGVLTITSEYSTGMIRASLTVQPRRGTVYAAKAAAVALVAMGAGLVASFTSFLLGQAILDRRDLGTSLSQPHVLRAVIGAGLFLAVSGLLALGLGAVLRSAAGAIAAAIAVLFMTLPFEVFLPAATQAAVDRWIPLNAGSQIWSGGGQWLCGRWRLVPAVRPGSSCAIWKTGNAGRLSGRACFRCAGSRRTASKPQPACVGPACSRLTMLLMLMDLWVPKTRATWPYAPALTADG
jgi:ABC-2 type transport system permease protein